MAPSAIHTEDVQVNVQPKTVEKANGHANGKTNNGVKNVMQVSAPGVNSDAPALHVIDSRTGRYYSIPISHNAVKAGDFKQIKTPANEEYEADQNEHGLRVFDPGYGNTVVSESQVTYIDGLKGMIQYRGYNIHDIVAADKNFYDTTHLLVWGSWPTDVERQALRAKFAHYQNVPQNCLDVIKAFPPKASIMGMTIAGLSALQSCDMDAIPAHVAKNLYLGNPQAVDEQIVRFMSSYSTITAAAYCQNQGREMKAPRDDLNYIENFFYMTGHVDPSTGLPNPRYTAYFEKLWILIADHEMTCSTAALLQTASSMPDVISAMISAISAMYGPLHGGAIEVAYKDIEAIGDKSNVPDKIARVKSGKERLYGYGHRIYRVEDPRYIHIRRILDELENETRGDPWLETAMELHRIASEDEYFISRKLRPNADLFAAFTYRAMGFPAEVILPISLLSRTQGLMAHWKEAMSGTARIWRPGQIYTGDLNKSM